MATSHAAPIAHEERISEDVACSAGDGDGRLRVRLPDGRRDRRHRGTGRCQARRARVGMPAPAETVAAPVPVADCRAVAVLADRRALAGSSGAAARRRQAARSAAAVRPALAVPRIHRRPGRLRSRGAVGSGGPPGHRRWWRCERDGRRGRRPGGRQRCVRATRPGAGRAPRCVRRDRHAGQLEPTLGRKLAISHNFYGWTDDWTAMGPEHLAAGTFRSSPGRPGRTASACRSTTSSAARTTR